MTRLGSAIMIKRVLYWCEYIIREEIGQINFSFGSSLTEDIYKRKSVFIVNTLYVKNFPTCILNNPLLSAPFFTSVSPSDRFSSLLIPLYVSLTAPSLFDIACTVYCILLFQHFCVPLRSFSLPWIHYFCIYVIL